MIAHESKFIWKRPSTWLAWTFLEFREYIQFCKDNWNILLHVNFLILGSSSQKWEITWQGYFNKEKKEFFLGRQSITQHIKGSFFFFFPFLKKVLGEILEELLS